MKFLWSWVPCYGQVAVSGGEDDDTRRPMKRRKRTRPEWRPKLCSITEDKVVVLEMKARSREGKKKAGATPGPGNGVRGHVRRHSGDYSGASVATTAAMPAFSPTPFVF